MRLRFPAFALVLLFASHVARADTISVVVGDKDGFGFTPACSNTGTCNALNAPAIDNRSAAEKAATSGAQLTDVYSSLFPGYGPNGSSTADVLLPFLGTLTSGTLSFGAGDFEASTFGAFSASINGVTVPFAFSDGRYVTAIHSFTLTTAQLSAANAVGYVDLHLDRNGSGDFVAFDYFALDGNTVTAATPEPSSLALLGTGLLAACGIVRRRLS